MSFYNLIRSRKSSRPSNNAKYNGEVKRGKAKKIHAFVVGTAIAASMLLAAAAPRTYLYGCIGRTRDPNPVKQLTCPLYKYNKYGYLAPTGWVVPVGFTMRASNAGNGWLKSAGMSKNYLLAENWVYEGR